MRFWDSSAIVALVVKQGKARVVRDLLSGDHQMAVWWGTPAECEGALARMARARELDGDALPELRARLARFEPGWTVVQPGRELRSAAVAALRRHPLKAGDALQLAAALEWGDGRGDGLEFVTLDERLARAAALEGFTVLPAP